MSENRESELCAPEIANDRDGDGVQIRSRRLVLQRLLQNFWRLVSEPPANTLPDPAQSGSDRGLQRFRGGEG